MSFEGITEATDRNDRKKEVELKNDHSKIKS